MSMLSDRAKTAEVLRPELTERQRAARERIYAMPLDKLDPAERASYQNEEMWWKFERLRAEQPVHFTKDSADGYGDYWSITRWEDIVRVDTDSVTFSNEAGITIAANRPDSQPSEIAPDGSKRTPEQIEEAKNRGIQSLLSMDPPKHGLHRGAVSESVSPANLHDLEPLIRERIAGILDGLPIGEEFDWVDKVSMELTAMTLATLFNYPQERRRELTFWSDCMNVTPGPGEVVETQEERMAAIQDFYGAITTMFKERAAAPPAIDFMSLMAHSPHVKDFASAEIYGDAIVLLVGGNDTTRNTLTGSVYALDRFPEENAKLRANPALIPSMVSETIRWQTPLTHMMRKANEDVEIGGALIKKGEKIALWYVSGNRDETAIDRPNEYIVDRKNPRKHISFGFGIHRCLGNRLAELQLRLTWEEILKRFPEIKVVGEPVRGYNNFAKGYDRMTVVIPSRF
ncbi:MAG TPA: cytochrome P450 [Microbacteriaceae bacterium]|nr:cytochrome P450 [Microbacteriaceae bacterium]